jgi:hypothetical protein
MNTLAGSGNAPSVTNVTASGTMQFGSLSDGTITITDFVDEDNMASNSAVKIPTQQSVKAYVDAVSTLSLIDEDNMATDSATRPPSQQSVKAFAESLTGTNIVATGALNAGTITSGFGNIDTGSSTITTTGAVATGALTATNTALINGTTPTLTIGDGGAEDAKILFDGNEQNFHIGLDDSTNKLTIGLGNALGTFPGFTMDENTNVEFPDNTVTIISSGNHDMLTLISTDADATSGPVIKLFRNSSSPADSDDVGKILFTAENDASEAIDYATIRGDLLDVTDGTEDGIIKVEAITAGSNLEMARFGDGVGVVLNESGNSGLDLRVESDNYSHCLFVDGGNDRVGVGENSDIGGLFRVSLGDSGVTGVNSAGQTLVIEDNVDTGLTIATPNNRTGAILFADSDDNDRGRIAYDHSNDRFFIDTNGNDFPCFFLNNGSISSNGEAAPDVDQGGLCLDQNAGDANLLTLKSSDIAHGMTAEVETDTYGIFQKHNPTEGGLRITGLSESGSPGIRIFANITSASTAESTTTEAAMMVNARLKDGTGLTGVGATGNAFAVVSSGGSVQFIVKGDGELFSNQSATVGTYDAYEDAQLIRAFDLNHMQGVINSKFDKFVQDNKDDLQRAKLIGTDDDGNATPFVNLTGMSRLHNGALATI